MDDLERHATVQMAAEHHGSTWSGSKGYKTQQATAFDFKGPPTPQLSYALSHWRAGDPWGFACEKAARDWGLAVYRS